ncbi:MAG TPA: DNA topoisomerase, partial [Candidatus Thermoplasmatota archaeon]
KYGPEYADKPRTYRTKSRNAQEAHEAIRPTSIVRTPESLARVLNRDQMRLYELVWKRMLASQMKDAILDSTTVDISAGSNNGEYTLRATGSVIKFDGFRTIYIEARDENAEDDNSRELPSLDKGDALKLQSADAVKTEQKFTQPAPRYSEAALIRTLEEKGIGRPSTYASIVGTIEARDYVVREKGRFKPSVLGTAVSEFLVANFPDIMDPGFTADMEDRLDAVASGQQEWVPMLEEFFTPFDSRLGAATKVERVPFSQLDEKTDESCEVCEAPMVIKSGRFGKFMSCSRFPDCRHTRPIVSATGVACPKCKAEGRDGVLMERKNRKGRTFYGCSLYPACNFLVGRKPLAQPCPDCKGLLITRNRSAAMCTNEECGWKGTIAEATPESEEDTANQPEAVEA